METDLVHVVLYTLPQAACDSNKMSWYDVAALIKNQISAAFGDSVSFEHIEFMSKRWFDNTRVQILLKDGDVNFPFVMVNNELACVEKKVNLSKIKHLIRSKLQS